MKLTSLARKLSAKSDHKQHHHAAIVTRGGAIVAVGWNKGDQHAEIRALKQVHDKRNLTVYCFRWAKSGRWALAKPCDKCAVALQGAKVYYTASVGELVRMYARRPGG